AAVGHAQRDDDGAVGNGANLEPAAVGQREEADLGAVGQPAERGHQSLTRSAILTIFFWSMLLRMAMPVRHDIAPARESGGLMYSGASVFLKIRSRIRSSPPPCPSVILGIGTFIRLPKLLVT